MSQRTSSRVTNASRFFPKLPHSPHFGHDEAIIGARDSELVEAMRRAKEELGEDHPLVVAAVKSLAAKERRRTQDVTYDSLSAEVLCTGKARTRHVREGRLAAVLAVLLGEEPMREAGLPGCRYQVDMLFKDHRLVVEEDGQHHRDKRYQDRDARVDALCAASEIKMLRIHPRDSIEPESLRERLLALGIAV